MTSSSRWQTKSLDQDAADVFLGGAGRRAVVVGQVEVGDAAVEGAAHDAAGFLEIVHPAEVVPETQRNGGQQQAGIPAAPVRHAAIVAGGIKHAAKLAVRVALAKWEKARRRRPRAVTTLEYHA